MEGEGEGDAFTDTCTHGSSLVGIEVGGWGGEGDPGGLGGGDQLQCEERGRRGVGEGEYRQSHELKVRIG